MLRQLIGVCPLRAKCTDAAPDRGRSVAIADNELLEHRLRKQAATGGLRPAYWVPYVCNADALDHGRVAEDCWGAGGAGEVGEESNSGAEKNRCDVDLDFVE